jgi:hypothetical protein
MRIGSIIAYLDNYLSRNGIRSIDPVTANAILENAGLLKDSKDRPGKPLRDLLRKGDIPHAYQKAGKGSNWTIPLSTADFKTTKHQTFESNFNELIKNTISQNANLNDILQLGKQLQDARIKYKPEHIKYLLVAQAPPDNLERFFYYENVHEHDYLFLGVIKAIYPTLKDNFLMSGRSSAVKKLILKKFQTDGFYLMDLSEFPLSKMTGNLESQVPLLIQRIKAVIDKKTKIILIKTDVYDISFGLLCEAGFENVINCKIPFPAQGGQVKFQSQFKEALKLAGYQ